MRINSIREREIPMAAEIRNAYVDFSTMTASIVAVESDVIRSGRPVTGYGFSSPGRYAQGEIIRSRAIPRIMKAEARRTARSVDGRTRSGSGERRYVQGREARRPR